jgi:hypothetical protein
MALYGDRILIVRYEDLVSSTQEMARRIFSHCGLDLEPAWVRTDLHTREIGRWRNYEPFVEPLLQAVQSQER